MLRMTPRVPFRMRLFFLVIETIVPYSEIKRKKDEKERLEK